MIISLCVVLITVLALSDNELLWIHNGISGELAQKGIKVGRSFSNTTDEMITT